jgi:hypothetical protein
MIKYYIIYNALGQILRTGSCAESDFDVQAQTGEFIIEGQANQLTQYIKDKQVADLPPQPEGKFYFYDYSTSQWVQNTTLLGQSIITQRDALLYASDWTQIPNAPLTTQQVQEWATYRQELRDIPQQSGFPTNVTFPVAPAG